MLDMKDTCSSLNVTNPCKETWFFMEEQLMEEQLLEEKKRIADGNVMIRAEETA